MCKLVAYYRVSTTKQGERGLGMDAQKGAVAEYAARIGKPIIAEFTEVESGKRNDRPELHSAIERCELTGARLVIAKLDRLSRNASFVLALQDAGIKFVACDLPEANETMIQFLAVMAQAERKAISDRTKAALKIAKERGTRLGNPDMVRMRKQRKAGNDTSMMAEARIRVADERAAKLARVLLTAQLAGARSLRQYAQYMNTTGIPTPRGSTWTAAAVRNVLIRLKDSNPPELGRIRRTPE